MSELNHSATPHFVGALTGRYVLGEQSRLAGVNIFACRVRTISPETLVASAPVLGRLGETITLWVPGMGAVSGRIARHTSDGFAVDIITTTAGRAELTANIETYRTRAWTGAIDKRSHHRHMPSEPRTVMLQDGRMTPCLIVDYSDAGAAISAGELPAIGVEVIIGQIAGTVVRHFDVGFAVHFAAVQNAEDTEDLLQAPDEWRSAVTLAFPAIDTSDETDPPELYGYVY